MRISVVIPTYWSRKKEDGWKAGDAVYDHPTALDGADTLGRTLESIKILNNKNFKLIIPVCLTTDDIEEEAVVRVKEIIEKSNCSVETYIFTPRNLREVQGMLAKDGQGENAQVLSQIGYPNVRNICLLTSHILGMDVTILIDDDEVFENPEFIDIAVEFIGKRKYGSSIYGVAGYYLNSKDEFYDDVKMQAWMTYWDRFGSKTKAFDKIIAKEPRLKMTPFAFGGLMVVHKNMFKTVPFDPLVTRGEDIDYLINAKMYGYDFFLDNKLNIKHLPPPKNHPVWKRFREDIYRFLYEKSKIDNQVEVGNMVKVSAEDFKPYPGDFLTDELEDKIFKTNVLLSMDYLGEGDVDASKGAIENIYLSKYDAIPQIDTFSEYRQFQKKWSEITEKISSKRGTYRPIMENNNLTRLKTEEHSIERIELDKDQIASAFDKLDGFGDFTKEEIKRVSMKSNFMNSKEEEFLFSAGDANDKFYIILKGSIRIIKRDSNNEEVLIARIGENGLIGETSFVSNTFQVDAIFDEYTELVYIEQRFIEEILESDPKLGVKLLRVIINKLFFKLEATNELVKNKAEQDFHVQDNADDID